MTAVASSTDLRPTFAAMPMTRGQIVAVALAVVIAGIDGYDTQSMAFVAPVVSKAWSMPKATLGLVLASSLVGMAGGALGLSPLADMVGRRPTMLGGLVLVTIGSLVSALSHSVGPLAASRAITGLGIGALVSLTTALAAEFASDRRRGLAVASTTVGFSAGGLIGGLSSSIILRGHDWSLVFAIGAGAGGALLLVAAAILPESPAFLLDRRPHDALARLNKVMRQLGRPAASWLPDVPVQRRVAYRALLAPGLRGPTLRFALVYLLMVTSAYYLLSWLPQLVSDAGFSPSTASLVAAVSTIVGIPAGLIFGAFAERIGPMRLAATAMIGFGLSLGALGLVPPVLGLLVATATACGFFLAASTAVFYAAMTAAFPALVRVSGIGFVMGFGRLFSGAGPFLGGALFAAGWTRTGVSLTFAGLAIVAGALLAAGLRSGRLALPAPRSVA